MWHTRTAVAKDRMNEAVKKTVQDSVHIIICSITAEFFEGPK
jgi:hypothetical protein